MSDKALALPVLYTVFSLLLTEKLSSSPAPPKGNPTVPGQNSCILVDVFLPHQQRHFTYIIKRSLCLS